MTQTAANRLYKATFILNTLGYEEPVDTLIGHLKEVLASVGGEVAEVHNLDRIEFIRVTKKEHTGDFYIQIDFEGPANVSVTLQEKFRLDKRVKRIFVQTLD